MSVEPDHCFAALKYDPRLLAQYGCLAPCLLLLESLPTTAEVARRAPFGTSDTVIHELRAPSHRLLHPQKQNGILRSGEPNNVCGSVVGDHRIVDGCVQDRAIKTEHGEK